MCKWKMTINFFNSPDVYFKEIDHFVYDIDEMSKLVYDTFYGCIDTYDIHERVEDFVRYKSNGTLHLTSLYFESTSSHINPYVEKILKNRIKFI